MYVVQQVVGGPNRKVGIGTGPVNLDLTDPALQALYRQAPPPAPVSYVIRAIENSFLFEVGVGELAVGSALLRTSVTANSAGTFIPIDFAAIPCEVYMLKQPAGGGGGSNTRGINTALRSEGSATLVVGTNSTIIIPYNMTISNAASWVIASDTTASVVVGVLRATVAAPNTFVSIAASAKPALTAAVRATGAMTGWSTSLLAGERVRLSVESASGTTAVQVLIPAEAA